MLEGITVATAPLPQFCPLGQFPDRDKRDARLHPNKPHQDLGRKLVLSYAEVAERLIVSEKTVGHHVSAVLRKLGEPTRPRAVATALRLGIIPPR